LEGEHILVHLVTAATEEYDGATWTTSNPLIQQEDIKQEQELKQLV
jgi:hypothetical protein